MLLAASTAPIRRHAPQALSVLDGEVTKRLRAARCRASARRQARQRARRAPGPLAHPDPAGSAQRSPALRQAASNATRRSPTGHTGQARITIAAATSLAIRHDFPSLLDPMLEPFATRDNSGKPSSPLRRRHRKRTPAAAGVGHRGAVWRFLQSLSPSQLDLGLAPQVARVLGFVQPRRGWDPLGMGVSFEGSDVPCGVPAYRSLP